MECSTSELWWVKGGVVKPGSVRESTHSPNPGFARQRCWTTGRACLNSSPPCEDVSRQAMRVCGARKVFSKLFSTGPPGARCEPPGPKFVCFRDSTFSLIGLGTQDLNSSSNTCHKQIESPVTQRPTNRTVGIAKPKHLFISLFLNAHHTNLAHAHTPPPRDGAV